MEDWCDLPPLAIDGVPGVPGAPAPLPPRPPRQEIAPLRGRLQFQSECRRLSADEAWELMERYQQPFLDQCRYWSMSWASSSGNGLLVFGVVRLNDGDDEAMFVRCAWPWAPQCLDDDGICVQPRLGRAGRAHGYLLTSGWGVLALVRGAANVLAGGQ